MNVTQHWNSHNKEREVSWQLIYIEESDDFTAPADTALLLGWWEEWPERFWAQEVNYAKITGSHLHGRATHWMPLPSPPETEK